MDIEEASILLQRIYERRGPGASSWSPARLTLARPTADPDYPWDIHCDWCFEDGDAVSLNGTGHGGDELDAVLNALWDARTSLAALYDSRELRWAGGPGLALPVDLVEYPPPV